MRIKFFRATLKRYLTRKPLLVLGMTILCICGCTKDPDTKDDGTSGPGEVGNILISNIRVDKTSIAEGLNVGLVDWSLTSEYFGQTVHWSVIDPDDPATDQANVDPNGNSGDDNGYLGTGEEFLPVILPTFHISQEDAINSINPVTTSTVDINYETKIWMKVYPDTSSYPVYHPGDNYQVTGIISSDTFHSDTVSAWKKMRIEYDRFSGINLPDTAWWVIEQVYSGFNFGGSLDFNRTPYVEFREDTIHLLEDDVISPHPQIRWNYLHTDLKNVRDVYRSQVLA